MIKVSVNNGQLRLEPPPRVAQASHLDHQAQEFFFMKGCDINVVFADTLSLFQSMHNQIMIFQHRYTISYVEIIRDIHANHWEFVLGTHVPTAMDGDEG